MAEGDSLSTQGIQATQNIYNWTTNDPTGSLGAAQSAKGYSFKAPKETGAAYGFGGYQYAPDSRGQGEKLNELFGQAAMGDQNLPTGPLAERDNEFAGTIDEDTMGPTVPNGHASPIFNYHYGPPGWTARPYTDGTLLGNIGAHMLAKNTWFEAGTETAADWGGGTNVGFTAGIQATLTHTVSNGVSSDITRSLQQTETVAGNGSASGKSRQGYTFGNAYGHSSNIQTYEQIREPVLVNMVGIRHIDGMVVG